MADIYRTLIANEDGIHIIDTIEFEGEFWLVPRWLDNKSEGWSKPERIIRLFLLPHQRQIGSPVADFVLNIEVPTAVLDGLEPSQDPRIEVVELPDIQIAFVQH